MFSLLLLLSYVYFLPLYLCFALDSPSLARRSGGSCASRLAAKGKKATRGIIDRQVESRAAKVPKPVWEVGGYHHEAEGIR